MGPARKPLAERFWPKVDKNGPNGCWVWLAVKVGGYGQINEGGGRGRCKYAHRVAYEMLVGPIPQGLELDHLCRNRACVNPSHLEPVTGQVNVLRGDTIVAANAAKTHCLRGHEFTPENTHRHNRRRICLACRTLHKQQRRRAA